MSARGGLDWRPLGYSDDPVPGNPDIVDFQCGHAKNVTAKLESAALNLRRLESGGMKSLTVDKIVDRARDLARDLDHAADIYRGLGQGLDVYAPKLRWAQAESLAALEAAGPAAQSERSTAGSYRSKWLEAANEFDPQRRQTLLDELESEKQRHAAAAAALESAKGRVRAAIRARDEAAEVAERTIRDNFEDSPLKDNFIDSVVEFLGRDDVQNVLKWIGYAALAITVAAAIVGTGGAAIGVIAAIGTVAGVLGSIGEVSRNLEEKDYGAAALNTGLALLSLIPGGKALKMFRGTKFGAGKFPLASAKSLAAVRSTGKKYLQTHQLKRMIETAPNPQQLRGMIAPLDRTLLKNRALYRSAKDHAVKEGGARLEAIRDSILAAPDAIGDAWNWATGGVKK